MEPHVHVAIMEGLQRQGGNRITAQGDGAAQFDDERLLQRATPLGRVLFSRDEALLILTPHWLQAGREFAGLVYGP